MSVWEELQAFSFEEIKTFYLKPGELVFPKVALCPSAIIGE